LAAIINLISHAASLTIAAQTSQPSPAVNTGYVREALLAGYVGKHLQRELLANSSNTLFSRYPPTKWGMIPPCHLDATLITRLPLSSLLHCYAFHSTNEVG
jgi:hypothetical protein